MATTLGVRSSVDPLPTGDFKGIVGQGGGGTMGWPPADNYFYANTAQTIPMQVGPFQKTGRYWICALGNVIDHVAGGWQAGVLQLRLVNLGGSPIADLNGFYRAFRYVTNENHPPDTWKNQSVETKFYCEANQGYYVQLLSAGGGGYYYSGYQGHLSLYAYTVGEGVY
jgi:hypothetical protein